LAGHAQAQVPTPAQPPPPLPQSQAQGAQDVPAAQGGQLQVQAPPPPPVEPEPPEQSHSTFGQGAFGGQATGLKQTQLPPSLSRAWQNPPLAQVAPIGHSVATFVHVQAVSAAQLASSRCRQPSLETQAPPGRTNTALQVLGWPFVAPQEGGGAFTH
jgi:hypothetical protein